MKTIFLSLLILITISFAAPAHSQTAIVIVDMQPDFFEGWNPSIKNRLIKKQVQLLKWAQQNNIPVLVFESAGRGTTFPELTAEISKLAQQAWFTKINTNGFHFNTVPNLNIPVMQNHPTYDAAEQGLAQLKRWEVQEIIITCVCASYCVSATTEEALNSGLRVHSSADLVANAWQYPARDWWNLIEVPSPRFEKYTDFETMKQKLNPSVKICARIF